MAPVAALIAGTAGEWSASHTLREAVGVGDENGRHRLVAHCLEQRANMALVGRAWIDNGDLAATDNVAERALEGEWPRIIRHDAADAHYRLVHGVGGKIEILVEGDVVVHAATAHGGWRGGRQWVCTFRASIRSWESIFTAIEHSKVFTKPSNAV